MIRPYILKETNWKAVKDTNFQLAILPWGATEAHNYHLPYGTDQYLADGISEEVGKISWEAGQKVIVLPSIPFGVNTGQMDISLCINMNPSTQLAVLSDISEVLVNADIPKLVILNAHGGNHFKQMIRELSVTYPELFICSVDWWKAGDTSVFEAPGDHAGELETSVVMHLHPNLVLPLNQAGDGAELKFKIKGFHKGYVSVQREWTRITKDTGVGDPKASTAIKGKIYFEDTVAEIANFITELAGSANDELYENE